jgi:GR25 family glycosyltransferase involved in LPS biosynthesis
LKEIIKHNYKYALVCQDDAYFRNDFQKYFTQLMENIPEDAEMVNIGFHSYANYETFVPWDLFSSPNDDFAKLGVSKVNSSICKLNPYANPCSLAYIVSLKGAKNLVDYFDKIGFRRATDHNFNTYLIEKNIYYGSLPVLCTGNAHLKSDIFTSS